MTVLLALLLVTLAACGSGSIPSTLGGGPPGQYRQLVTFAGSLTYVQALRIVTDLGLQPDLNCAQSWQPNGQRSWFASIHGLIVQLAYLSNAPDWYARLPATPGVVRVQRALDVPPGMPPVTPGPDTFEYTCPTPKAVVSPLTSSDAGTFVQVAFDARQTYDDALYTISDLGLHLADPCYEQALLAQKSPAWHPMGQETAFAATQTLVVQTGHGVTATIWQQQVSAIAGVVRVVTPYTAQC